MRKLITVAGGLALAAWMSTPALAGDYHTGATLHCSDCHIMHYSQKHGYAQDGSGFFLAPGAAGPYIYLLRNKVNDLCLGCHDNSVAADVLGANTGDSPTDIREAGFLNRLGMVGFDATGHTLDTLDVAPGGTWKPEDDNGTGEGLDCVNCHHQHAYGGFDPGGSHNQYRNLKYDVGTYTGGYNTDASYVSYNDTTIGTFNGTKDVFERSAAHYDESQIDFAEPDPSGSTRFKGSAMAYWCAGCHGLFHGNPGDPNIGGGVGQANWKAFKRHPTSVVNIGQSGVGGNSSLATFKARVNKVKVMSASGDWSGNTADVTPTCISCHKAHGNDNAFGLIERSGGGTKNENGDTLGGFYESLCAQCHVQASYYAK